MSCRLAVHRLVTRRVVAVVAFALVGGLTLAGCRTDPAVAAYVGSETITEAQVDQVLAELPAAPPSPSAGEAPRTEASRTEASPPRVDRSDVLSQMVLGRACEALRAQRGFTGAPVTPERVAEAAGVPAASQYAKERSTAQSCLSAAINLMLDTVGGPTDADLRDIYDRAKAKGLVEVPLETIKDRMAADAQVRQAVAAKQIIAQIVADGRVSVNPRYRPMEFVLSDLGTGAPLVVAVLGEPGSDAVRDLT
jgi:hypothetical protein